MEGKNVMIDISKYYVNGRIEREKIVMDIIRRKLSHNEIEELVSNDIIQNAFIGNFYKDKVPKEQWTKEYIQILSCAVVGESFNRDYLFYLETVVKYVEKKSRNVIFVIGGIILLAIIIFIMILIFK